MSLPPPIIQAVPEPDEADRTCPECQAVLKSKQGLSMHLTRTHGHATKKSQSTPRRRVLGMGGSGVRAELRAMEVVASLFPKGIPTDDPVQLMQDFALIDQVRSRVQ